jgi:hypothetical protein
MRHRIAFGIALVSIVAVSSADTPTFSIDAHILATGASVHAQSSCFGLDAVIAEPVAGFSSGGIYDLSTGFAAVSPIVNDTIFANGFEDCTP